MVSTKLIDFFQHSHNVIIDGNGIPKLTDFGQDLFETIDYQKIERRIPYTAPEVLTNGQHSVEKSSDIYAIGFLIWEIWARKPPFENEEKSQLTEKIIGGKRETFDITTPEIYSNLSKKCWCAERQSRPCIDYCIATLNGHNLSHM
jgi:serine/threonine protein kinase